MLFSLLINVKMPTIVGILTFIRRKIFLFSSAEHEKSFKTWGLYFFGSEMGFPLSRMTTSN